MSQEKMKILTLLEQGKITASEATELINSLDTSSSTKTQHSLNAKSIKKDSSNISSYARNIESGLNTIGDKLDEFVKDVSPIAKKYSKIATDKASLFAKNVTESIVNVSSKQANSVQKTIKLQQIVTGNANVFNLAGLNSNVRVHGYNGDSITITANVKTKIQTPILEISVKGNIYELSYNKIQFHSISADAYIPYSLFSTINISNENSTLEVMNLSCNSIVISNNNAPTIVCDIVAKDLKLNTSEATVNLSNVKVSNSSFIENCNADCTLNDIDICKLNLSTSNASLILNNALFKKESVYNWNLNTSNGNVTVKTPNSMDVAFDIKCNATFGNIELNLLGVSTVSKENYVKQARSVTFDNKDIKVKMDVETTNGTIKID
jgi:hypothetical protein